MCNPNVVGSVPTPNCARVLSQTTNSQLSKNAGVSDGACNSKRAPRPLVLEAFHSTHFNSPVVEGGCHVASTPHVK